MIGRKLVIPSEDWVVDLEYVKQQLRIDHNDDDTMLEGLIAANEAYFDGPDGFLQRALVDQTWDFFIDALPDATRIEIPFGPLIEIEEVFSRNEQGDETPVTDFIVDDTGRFPFVVGGSWPTKGVSLNSVRVRGRFGYLDTGVSPPEDAVPDDIKQAILLRIKADYDGGDDADKLREIANNIVRYKYRTHRSLA